VIAGRCFCTVFQVTEVLGLRHRLPRVARRRLPCTYSVLQPGIRKPNPGEIFVRLHILANGDAAPEWIACYLIVCYVVDIESQFGMVLGRVSRRWRTRLDERLRHLGLTQARWHTLFHLNRLGPMPQHQLAECLDIEGPTLVRLLDGLERQGLIERRLVQDDRRIRCVHLTAAAGPLIEEIASISTQLRHELLADVDQDALAAALGVLQQLDDRLEEGGN